MATKKSAFKPAAETNWNELGRRMADAPRTHKVPAEAAKRVATYQDLTQRFNDGERTPELARDIAAYAPAEA